MAEEAAAWADVAPTFLEIGRNDALADIDRILDDNDDVYIGLPSAGLVDLSGTQTPERDGIAGWPWGGRVNGCLSPRGAIGGVLGQKCACGTVVQFGNGHARRRSIAGANDQASGALFFARVVCVASRLSSAWWATMTCCRVIGDH